MDLGKHAKSLQILRDTAEMSFTGGLFLEHFNYMYYLHGIRVFLYFVEL